YARDLFNPPTIERLLEHYENILHGVAADPHQRISALAVLGEAELQQLLGDWNDTRRVYPHRECVHKLFEKQVLRSPQATALVFGTQSLKYKELNTRANQLAHYLRRLNVGPEAPVGVCAESPIILAVCWLAILKAGGAYVPLDPGYPKERL